jgi:hypothetical protein
MVSPVVSDLKRGVGRQIGKKQKELEPLWDATYRCGK